MTEQQIKRSSDLMFARGEIVQYLSAADPESALIKSYLESAHDFQRRDGKRMATATVVEITLTNAKRCEGAENEDADSLCYWFIPRNILDAALRAHLDVIAKELSELGVV